MFFLFFSIKEVDLHIQSKRQSTWQSSNISSVDIVGNYWLKFVINEAQPYTDTFLKSTTLKEQKQLK
jgi:hypothetical protein